MSNSKGKMKILAILLTGVALSGCSYTMQLMPRDSGTIYQGEIKSNGAGSGKVLVGLGDRTCMGTFATAASGETFGLAQTFGARGTSMTTVATTSGAAQYKALLACSDGSGLRCDVSGTDSGAGICVDSKNRVYDMLYSR